MQLSSRRSVVVQCSQQASGWQRALPAAALSAAILCMQPAPAEARQQALADLVRDSYSFVDQNKDGVITAEELRSVNKNVSQVGWGDWQAGPAVEHAHVASAAWHMPLPCTPCRAAAMHLPCCCHAPLPCCGQAPLPHHTVMPAGGGRAAGGRRAD
jgi:hypothetical protein